MNCQLTDWKIARGLIVIHAEPLIRALHTFISEALYPYICFINSMMITIAEAFYHMYAIAISKLHIIATFMLLQHIFHICTYLHTCT